MIKQKGFGGNNVVLMIHASHTNKADLSVDIDSKIQGSKNATDLVNLDRRVMTRC